MFGPLLDILHSNGLDSLKMSRYKRQNNLVNYSRLKDTNKTCPIKHNPFSLDCGSEKT